MAGTNSALQEGMSSSLILCSLGQVWFGFGILAGFLRAGN